VIGANHVAVLDPPVPALKRPLEYTVRTFEPGGPAGWRQVVETRRLWDLDFRGRLAFSAGLWPRLREVLRESGYSVDVHDLRRPGPRLRPDRALLESCDDGELQLLGAVTRNLLGQIEVRHWADAIEQSALICRLFPRARVVVAAATRRQAGKVWRALQGQLGEAVGLALAGVRRPAKRVLVATFGGVPANTAGEWDILLLPSGEEATGTRAVDLACRMAFRRIYAFVRPQRRPDWLVQLRREQLAAAVIHHLARPRVPVRVRVLPTPPGTVAGATTALQRKRTLYWYNTKRNERVASVARAAAGGDLEALQRFGVRAGDVPATPGARPRVAVLVETLKHARRLLRRLPGWRLLHRAPTTGAGEAQASGGQQPGPAVVTAVYAATRRLRADVWVVAAGTAWAARLKGFPPRRRGGGPGHVLLLDFDDAFDARAAADAGRRVREYERRGMAVAAAARAE
jgi:hypothetical protein